MVSTSHGKVTSSATNSTTTTKIGSTISGGTRLPMRLPEKTGKVDTKQERDEQHIEESEDTTSSSVPSRLR